MPRSLKHVKFEPSIGKRYGIDSPFGIPVMILGESHYGAQGESRSFTRRVIRDVKSGKKKHAFFGNVAKAFLIDPSNPSQRKAFWDSVVFYNYVQTSVELGTRPALKTWLAAQEPFLEVLASLKPRPRLIAVFGWDTWENTPDRGRDVHPIKHQGRKIPCYEFNVGRNKSLAPKLKHPSRAFNLAQTRPVVLKALKRAGGHEFRG